MQTTPILSETAVLLGGEDVALDTTIVTFVRELLERVAFIAKGTLAWVLEFISTLFARRKLA